MSDPVDRSEPGALLARSSPTFPPGPWRARWIWADGAPAGRRHTVVLTTRFDVETVPSQVAARWCAVSRAVVYVNGHEVGRGPVRANPRRQPWEDVDLAPYLVAGANTVRVVALTYASPTPWYLPMPPFASDLANGAFVFEADLGDRWLVTDASWTADVLDGWGSTPGAGVSGRGVELLDMRSLPDDAVDTGPPATERRAHAVGEAGRSTPPSYPLGPYGPRSTSPLTERSIEFDDLGDGLWATDRIVAGTVVLEADGPPGAEVTITIAEMADSDGHPVAGDHDASVRITLDGSMRRAESLDRYGGRGAVVSSDDDVVVRCLGIVERLYPVVGASRFACSDPVLDRIHEVGRRSVTLNSTDAYTDCPTREQRAWTGDSVVHQLVDLTTNDDWLLARRNVALVADSRRPDGMLPMAVGGDAEDVDFTIIPDWSLHWIHAVWNLYRYVGDRDEIAALLPVVEGVLRWFEQFTDDRGLVRDVVGWVIIDWSSVHTDGACTALNGLLGRALLEFAEMSDWLGDRGRAEWSTARHARLREGFEALWDPERERYVDSVVGVRATDPGERRTASEHAQAAAIVGRVVDAERTEHLVDLLQAEDGRVFATFSSPDHEAPPNSEVPVGGAYLRAGHPEPWWDVDGLVVAQPFFSYVVHDALAQAGRADLVAERCRRWEIALERCDTSWTETWFGGTISHGWSSTPTRDLVQRVLGVTPAEPGFTVAAIEPALGDLDWAEGTVPTPHGTIDVRVDLRSIVVTSPVPILHRGTHLDAGHHVIALGPDGGGATGRP